MKTLKITLVATIAATMGWWLRLPHKIWPSHPYLADVLLSLILCIVLQFAWSDPKKSDLKNSDSARSDPKKEISP